MSRMNWVKCYTCTTPKPRRLMHEHHKVPRGAGGSDDKDNLVFLCPNCHHNLHRFGELIQQGKSAHAADLASLEYPTPAPRDRIMKLAQLAAKSFNLQGSDENDNVTISVTLPKELVKRLKVLASEYPAERGRRMGVPKLAALVLTQHLIRKGLWRTDDDKFPIFSLTRACRHLLATTPIPR